MTHRRCRRSREARPPSTGSRRRSTSASCAASGACPNLEELGVFSVMWSEHCSYKSSRALLRELPTTRPARPAGAGRERRRGRRSATASRRCSRSRATTIRRSSSRIQGAATGVGGILRDVFTMGARPIAILDSLRFGSFDHPRTPLPGRAAWSAASAATATASACRPSAARSTSTPGYDENILVNAFTLGIVRADRIFRAQRDRRRQPGHLRRLADRPRRHPRRQPARVGRVRRDHRGRSGPTVQVGDPFTEKLLLEACLELMETRRHRRHPGHGRRRPHQLARSRWRRAAALGIVLDLDQVPLREAGHDAVRDPALRVAGAHAARRAGRARGRRCCEIFARWDLEAVVIGRVTDDGMLRVRAAGEEVVCAAGRAAGARRAGLRAAGRAAGRPRGAAAPRPRAAAAPSDYSADAAARCSTSPEPRARASGSTASTTSSSAATPSCGPARTPPWCASRAPRKALALTVDCNSRYCLLDPYVGAVIAVVEAARNVRRGRRRAARRHRLPQLRQPREARRSCGSSSRRSRASATPASRSARRS